MILFIQHYKRVITTLLMILIFSLGFLTEYSVHGQENSDEFGWYFELCKITNSDKIKAQNVFSLIAYRDQESNRAIMKTIDQNNAEIISKEISAIIKNTSVSTESIKQGILKMYEHQKNNPEVVEYVLEGLSKYIQYSKESFTERGFKILEELVKQDTLDWLVFFNIFKEATDSYNAFRDIKMYNLIYQDAGKVKLYNDVKDLETNLKDKSLIRTMSWFVPHLEGWLEILNSDNMVEERVTFIEYMNYYHLIDKSKRKSDGLYPVETTEDEQQQGSVKSKFKDLTSVSWAREYIETLASEGVLSGVGEGTFAPNNNVKREEFAKMLVGAFALKDDNAATLLSDVGKDKWYYSFVSIAEKLKIVNGIGENKFGVGSNITRQDMAVMAYRASKVAGTTISATKEAQKFTDESNIANYAKESVTLMQQAGIISGMDGGRFAPNENATRAQAAKIIYMLTRK